MGRMADLQTAVVAVSKVREDILYNLKVFLIQVIVLFLK